MNKFKVFLKNMFFSIFSNALNLVVTAATSLLIPLLLGSSVVQYGYYQLYLFYIAYVGFFHFGLCDGVLLKEGGKEYSRLSPREYSFQLIALALFETLVSTLIIVFLNLKKVNDDYLFIGIAFGINLIVFLPRNLLAYILQATNRIKESSLITIIGRTIYLFSLIVFCLFGINNYKCFIIGDLIGKSVALIYAMYQCRDIVLSRPIELISGLTITLENISSGIKLMLASISGMVITGIVQMSIQTHWSIETYGEISLTLSLTNLVLTFISAIAIVLYPTLRRLSGDTAIGLYDHIHSIIMPVLMMSLFFCKPLQIVLLKIFPQYYEGLLFLPILFPVCIFSAKVSLLVQTYMQVFRMEKDILIINVVSIFVTLLFACSSVYIFNSLFLTVLTILISQIFRCVYAEYVLSKKIAINYRKSSFVEIVIVALFIICSVNNSVAQAMLFYSIIYAAYLVVNRKKIFAAITYIKNI